MERACDRLSLDGLRRHLTTEIVGHHIYIFGSVDSTNSALARLADRGATEGTVVLAEAQTAGHGRHGSAWFSPEAANLYVSVLFHPRIAPRELPLFAPIASLALAEAVWLAGAPARIKWPSDVVVGGRKLGGVLVLAPVISGRLAYVILGIGVNLNVQPAELAAGLGPAAESAASLHDVLGRPVDRNTFAASLLNRLERWHQTFLTRGPAAVHAAWQARDVLRGHRLEARTAGEVCEGWGRGIDTDGSLIVEGDDGQARHIVAGAVRVLDGAAREED
ncbi:MAG TPA: biotin--[acetyl-CoA-carboxylase] ligase [Candidatus Acidoferrum sp.]|jgi:BirA family biotin operon repressor/biotin-[acetyl-CoA-carboxylase] ligase|nr:biotin--[acetyl-CoA-carboxylase] ligase [Candidatus Acidoferrum sp.]